MRFGAVVRNTQSGISLCVWCYYPRFQFKPLFNPPTCNVCRQRTKTQLEYVPNWYRCRWRLLISSYRFGVGQTPVAAAESALSPSLLGMCGNGVVNWATRQHRDTNRCPSQTATGHPSHRRSPRRHTKIIMINITKSSEVFLV